MIRRQSAQKVTKPLKTQRNQKGFQLDICSRVGSDYQVDIPKCNAVRYKGDAEDNKVTEIRVWSPDKQPSDKELSEYLMYASKYDYPHELALILLHWHEYNISNAIDDIPNYSPVLNKWTKCEIRKFLKCIDSKPRKNFVEAKKSMPGRPMGEICQLYYSIAAPFKAPTRTKSHSELIEQCFARAVRTGHITNRWVSPTNPNPSFRSASSNTTSVNIRKPGETEDPLEQEFELHLVSLVGMSKARRLLGRRMLSTPYPLPVPSNRFVQQNGRHIPETNSRTCSPTRSLPISNTRNQTNGCTQFPLLPSLIGIDCQNRSNSSGASSQLGSESTSHVPTPRHALPPGVHYDHDEFLAFLSTTEQQLEQERLQVLDCSGNLDMELLQQVNDLDLRAMSLLNETELLKPSCGFPEISYRWTKPELALVLTAMSRYGDDFSAIARTIGSKTEGFIRDFYNQCRNRFPLDEIIRYAKRNNSEPDKTPSPDNQDLMLPSDLRPQSPDTTTEQNPNNVNTPVPAVHKPQTLPDSEISSTLLIPKPEEEDLRLKHTASKDKQASNSDSSTSLLQPHSKQKQTRDLSLSSSSSSPPAKRQTRPSEQGSSGVTRGRPRGRGRARGRARGRPSRGRGAL